MEGRTRRIRDWSTDDRPRDKLYNKKPAELSNAELLAMLIGPGNARFNSVQLANNVLATCGDRLSEVARRSINDFMRVSGIGRAKACALVAFAELSRRREVEDALERTRIRDSREAAAYLTPLLKDLHYTVYGVLFLNTAGQIIQFEIPFEGGITSTTVDVRVVFKKALMHRAVSIILCHNQIAGTAKPSEFAEALTERFKRASKYLDIKLLDHIIIGEKGYYSFADEGKLA